ncbi:outer membrane protein [Chelativorans sp. YIM 93263]|uniref:outer membrane protein n=1 Tax=Chelativorans sp. YIM 93263 TaxID=2906648 RepID=UPI00403DD2E7
MLKRTTLFATLAVLGLGTSAYSADLERPRVVQPPKYTPPPPAKKPVIAGWYLRGHIGMSNQRVGSLHNVLFDGVDDLDFLDPGGFSSAPVAGGGVGYRFNSHLRGDITAEYRGKADFSALDRYDFVDDGDPSTWDGTNEYSAKKSEWLLLANAYVDLGSWHGISPYVGAGIGASRNTIHHFRDINVPNEGVAYGGTDSKWNFAWALHAGLGYQITDALTLDVGYSYLDLGDAQSGDIITYEGANTVDNPMHFEDLTSHDFKLGFRYQFGGGYTPEPEYVAYDPAPSYKPPVFK